MSENVSDEPNNPARYTPFGVDDYLIVIALIGSVILTLAITVFVRFRSKHEEMEDNQDVISSDYEHYDITKLVRTKKSLTGTSSSK
jgi:hypothetical protein